MDGFGLTILVLAVAGVATAGVTWVPEGMERTVKRFGRPRRTLGPGLHFTLPFIDSVDEPRPRTGPPDVV